MRGASAQYGGEFLGETPSRTECLDSLCMPQQNFLLPLRYSPRHSLEMRADAWQQSRLGGEFNPFLGRKTRALGITARGILRSGNALLQGRASYAHRRHEGVEGGLVANPQLLYPYLLTDGNRRTLREEQYRLAGLYAYSWTRVALGIQGKFCGTTRYAREDPRPKTQVGDFTIRLGSMLQLGQSYAYLAVHARRYLDALSVYSKSETRNDIHYFALGGGEYDHAISIPQDRLRMQFLYAEWGLQGDFCLPWPWLPTLYVQSSWYTAHPQTAEREAVNRVNGQTYALGLRGRYRVGALRILPHVYASYGLREGHEIYYGKVLTHRDPDASELRPEREQEKWGASSFRTGWTLGMRAPLAAMTCELLLAQSYAQLRSLYVYPPRAYDWGGLFQQAQLDLSYPLRAFALRLGLRADYARSLLPRVEVHSSSRPLASLLGDWAGWLSRESVGAYLRVGLDYEFPSRHGLFILLEGGAHFAPISSPSLRLSLGYRFRGET